MCLYPLNISRIKGLIDAMAHSEHGKVIRRFMKPGSVERSRDLYEWLTL
jgi:hypothetical protein